MWIFFEVPPQSTLSMPSALHPGLEIALFRCPAALLQFLFFEQIERIVAARIPDKVEFNHRLQPTQDVVMPSLVEL